MSTRALFGPGSDAGFGRSLAMTRSRRGPFFDGGAPGDIVPLCIARGGDQAEVIAFAFGTLLDQMRGVADSQPDPTHQTPTWAERVRLRRRSL